MEDPDDDIVEISPCKRYSRCNEILGRGAFKTVYKGFDEVDGIEVAWNQVSIDEAFQTPHHLEMLYVEVHLLKTLKHEKIIKSYMSWVDVENKTINMITELFTSGSLRQYRRKHRSVDVKAIKNWARQILHGLHYLHSHNPPIIHRDLKCDNIFINGNHGEVKLGDLGLATIMLQPTAKSVIGTPEFMAPELYDEEYNELVDIYSFGMCMLELATCEYPYSECKNAAQIFKVVTSGRKPAALAKVKDPSIKQFIEKCLLPASDRLSAAELLNDPFLLCECSKEILCVSSHVSDDYPECTNFPSCAHFPLEVDPKHKDISSENSTESMNTTSHLSNLEIQRHNNKNNFKLWGEKLDSDSLYLILRISYPCEPAKNVHFTFYLYLDTVSSVASEMVVDLGLPNDIMPIISEMINDLVLKFESSGKSSSGTSDTTNSLSDVSVTSHVDAFSTSSTGNQGFNDIFNKTVCENYILSAFFELNNGFDESVELSSGNYDKVALDTASSSSTRANTFGECNKEITRYDSACSDGDAYFTPSYDITSYIDSLSLMDGVNDKELHEELKLELDSIDSDAYFTPFRDIGSNISSLYSMDGFNEEELSEDLKLEHDAYFTPSREICSNISSLSLMEMDGFSEEEISEDLKLELDAIEVDYQRCFCDLMSMRQDAIENLKRRWITRGDGSLNKNCHVSCKWRISLHNFLYWLRYTNSKVSPHSFFMCLWKISLLTLVVFFL